MMRLDAPNTNAMQSPAAMAKTFAHAVRYAISLLWQTSPRYTAGLLITAILSAPAPAVTLFIGKLIIDEVVRATTTPAATPAPLLLGLVALQLIVLLLNNALQQLNTLFGTLLGNAFVPALHDRILAKSSELDLAFFENSAYYDALHRASNEASFRPMQILQSLISLVQGVFGLISFVIVLLGFNGWAIVALLVGAVVSLITQTRYGIFEFASLDLQVPAVRRLHYLFWMLTNSTAAKEVRLYDLGEPLRKKYGSGMAEQLRVKSDLARRRLGQAAFTGGLGGVLFSVVYGVMVLSAAQGQLSIGDLTLFAGAFQQSQSTLGMIVFSVAQILEASLFLQNIERFFAYQPVLKPGAHAPAAQPLREGLALHDVSFAYPNSATPVLRNIDLELKPGQVMAVVGENGAGKTTLIKLLCRLYDPTGGAITLEGVPLSDYDPHALRARYCVLFQDFMEYQATVGENIGYGNVARLEDALAIEAAAVRAGAAGFISELPAGYDTMLGQWFEGAQGLSKGQWQLVALARAFFRDAAIVILDEPTASLSPTKEQEVFGALRASLRADQIGIIVSHRFSTVRLADVIIVVEDGKITERGTHEALMKQAGTYARLYTLQASAYADAVVETPDAANA